MEQFDGDAINLNQYDGDAINPDMYNKAEPNSLYGIQITHGDGLTDEEFRDKIANLLELEKCFNEKHYISIDATEIIKKMSKEDLIQLIAFYNRAIAKTIDSSHNSDMYKEIINAISYNIEEYIQIMARNHMSISENMRRQLSLKYAVNSNGTGSVENIAMQMIHSIFSTGSIDSLFPYFTADGEYNKSAD